MIKRRLNVCHIKRYASYMARTLVIITWQNRESTVIITKPYEHAQVSRTLKRPDKLALSTPNYKILDGANRKTKVLRLSVYK